jgi:hypothetical protein
VDPLVEVNHALAGQGAEISLFREQFPGLLGIAVRGMIYLVVKIEPVVAD